MDLVRVLLVGAHNVICLAIDGLHTGMVGAYGNSWIRTHHFDHLASQSFLFDQAIAESPVLESTYAAMWQSGAEAARSSSLTTPSSLMSLCRAGGWHTALVTDEPRIARLPAAAEFDETRSIEQPPVHASAADAADTNLARLFAAAEQWVSQMREPFLLWIHAQAFYGPWDAPYAYRQRFADEDDPPPPTFVDPPQRWLAADHDPDERLGISHAYAGQMALVDECLGTLCARIGEAGLDATTQLTLIAPRGYPLGEHLRVGPCDDALYSELAQLAWLMRFPDELGRLDRTSSLVVPADLPQTLLDWLGLDAPSAGAGRSLMPLVRGEAGALRDRVVLHAQHEQALRTAAWLLRKPQHGPSELYAKPSDRWEVNDVAKLCPEIVSGLEAALAQAAEPGQASSMPALAPALTTELD